MAVPSISHLERGARNPTITIIGRLAKSLKVKSRSLLE
ncbi:MAG: helix-turn-helix domain-containing protein [Altererythrobacter sp.]|nr:helix-turn-helix domain-containing protein [Altererythrobacter sp.]